MHHEDDTVRGSRWLWVCIALVLFLFAVSGIKGGSWGQTPLTPSEERVLQAGN